MKNHVRYFFIKAVDYFNSPIYVVSYPKAGRTWLRLLLASVLFSSKSNDKKVELTTLTRRNKKFRTVVFSHHDYKVGSIKVKNISGKKNIILLVRDPRDIVVSSFFEHTLRTGGYKKNGKISEFIHDDDFGITSIVNFYNNFYKNNKDNIVLLIKYEDLHSAPVEVINAILKLVCSKGQKYSEIDIFKAIESCKFNKLQKKAESSSNPRMMPFDKNNPDSQKFRRGRIGSFVDYFDEDQQAYLNLEVKKLNTALGFSFN